MNGEIFYVPIEKATIPAGSHCLVDRYWIVHPEKGIAFYAQLFGYGSSDEPSPQCNTSEYVVRFDIQRRHPDCVVKKIPVVFTVHAQRKLNTLKRQRRANA